jgi:hypothetical protein
LADRSFTADELGALGLNVISHSEYSGWKAATRVLMSVWRNEEPFIWLLSSAEVARLA